MKLYEGNLLRVLVKHHNWRLGNSISPASRRDDETIRPDPVPEESGGWRVARGSVATLAAVCTVVLTVLTVLYDSTSNVRARRASKHEAQPSSMT